jgi:flagellar P-ring protein FlgI
VVLLARMRAGVGGWRRGGFPGAGLARLDIRPVGFSAWEKAPRLGVLVALGLLLGSALLGAGPARATRVRDLARFDGVRDNQLVGYGLVIGLDGTGDKRTTGFTLRTMSNLLESMGVTMRPEEMAVKNVAAVLVTATLPPFARAGSQLDITVASIGDASSLRGGVLVQTALEAADGTVYAVAQGPLLVGGYQADSPGGTRVAQNLVTVGRVPGGAIVERGSGYELPQGGVLTLLLDRPDFTTAQHLAEAVRRSTGRETVALDAGTVRILPGDSLRTSPVELMARIGEVEVEPGAPARVVINERTGTIVAGGQVRLMPVAIAHGSLSIKVQTENQAYLPGAFAPPGTQSQVLQNSTIEVSDRGGAFVVTPGASTLQDLAQALNTLGVTPRDVIAIFQALREAGALQAELVVM